jgi:GT2 family glycosyltransferase
MHAVTYGPFPGGWPASFEADFRRIAAAGFNVIRMFEMPDRVLLDEAWQHGLRVFGGLKWGQNADFLQRPALYTSARVALVGALKETAGHPALAGVYVGNEVPPDLVRWMGPLRVRQALERLIALGRETAPDLLFAYANYPSSEYLEPANADFSAFNVYLEEPEAFRKYLKRLHHIAGDRPLVISEFGLDSRRNGVEQQARTLAWAHEISRAEETAGLTVYAWSDRWWNSGAEVLDWDFGLVDRDGIDKPALAMLQNLPFCDSPSTIRDLPFSVIICTRNGRARIGKGLEAVRNMTGGGFETIVVDDGSDDGTADFVAENFPWVRLLRLDFRGLSAARNAGAAASNGEILAFTDDDCEPDREWLVRLSRVFADGRFVAVGGPNLPPKPQSWREAVVCVAAGAPSHVMLDDEEAEHLPGCNLAVTKLACEAIGGFDPAFHTAGDDVDFCWRLRAAGFRLGFAPGAFVWHWRRPSILAFLSQQLGYGRAERLLIAKHPEHFSKHGGAKWRGFVYGGGPVRVMADSIIDHGPMGAAGYQSVTNRMLPLRGLDSRFDLWNVRLMLRVVECLAPRVRAWVRKRTLCLGKEHPTAENQRRSQTYATRHEFDIAGAAGTTREQLLRRLLLDGWQPGGPTDDWDAEKSGSRILLATEHGDDGSQHILVRVWGEHATVERLLKGRNK